MLMFGLKVSLIGMGIVYLALILLVYIIKGFSRLSALYAGRGSKDLAEREGGSKVPVSPMRGVGARDDAEIAAVIGAAIAAYRRDTA